MDRTLKQEKERGISLSQNRLSKRVSLRDKGREQKGEVEERGKEADVCGFLA